MAMNFADRRFVGWRPRQVWVSHITFVGPCEGRLYPSAIPDSLSQFVIRASMSGRINVNPIWQAWRGACRELEPAGVLLRFDRDSQDAGRS
ncbi:hypothetical protein [Burkholderia sp. SCN-KJ]|uniref:hypothetical protein n=1 Tax=Burkholderia sp. SCN-KJ TaxID=2969248 RepID=UPI00214FB3AE|nr:hypothetical protein [Burkholderia sp. SCN-KJ]MCR4470475.1 hypothetical protein [Burkholderia sp. SCN-KJ]